MAIQKGSVPTCLEYQLKPYQCMYQFWFGVEMETKPAIQRQLQKKWDSRVNRLESIAKKNEESLEKIQIYGLAHKARGKEELYPLNCRQMTYVYCETPA